MFLKVLIGLYAIDTSLTAYATTHGTSIEVNPLYWSFHNSLAAGLMTRLAIGLTVFYWLHKHGTPRMLRAIVGVYGALLVWMTSINFLM